MYTVRFIKNIFKTSFYLKKEASCLRGEYLKNYRQYDKVQKISNQRQIVKYHLFLIFTHSYWPHPLKSKLIISGLLNVWKHAQSTFKCSKLTRETREQSIKYVQSEQ